MMIDGGVTHTRSPSPIIKQEEGKKKEKKDSLPPNVTSVVALIINTV